MKDLLGHLDIAAGKQTGITFIRSESRHEFMPYKDLLDESTLMLGRLNAFGITAGHELIVFIEDPRQFLVVFWACLRGGIIPIPLAAAAQSLNIQKLVNVWQSLQSPYIFCDPQTRNIFSEQYFEPFPGLLEQLTPRLILGHEKEPIAPLPVTPPSANDIAFIQYSSGSTGDPKGVTLTHDNIITNALDIIRSSNTTGKDSALCWMPLTHDMGLIGFHLTSLIAGIQQYIIPTPLFIKRPLLWLEMASAFRVTQLYSPNFGYHYVLSSFNAQAHPNMNLSAVRIIYNGAEPISPEVTGRFFSALEKYGLKKEAMMAVYGLAEASVAVTIPTPGAPLRSFNLSRQHLKRGDTIVITENPSDPAFVAVGRPLSHCELRIADQHDVPQPDSTIGQIQIKGRNVTRGYYKNKTATGSVFTKDGWLRTGDLGFLHEGQLVITGRIRNMYIANGQNYFYHDIENVVTQALGLDFGKAAALGASNAAHEESLIIFIVHKGNAAAFDGIGAAVKEAVFSRLGLTVSQVLPIKKIPRTTSGKVQYFKLAEALQEGAYAGALAVSHAGDASLPAEARVLRILEKAFARKLEANDDVWSAGLNSIGAIRLSVELSNEFNTPLQVADLFTHATPAQLAAHLAQPQAHEAATPAADHDPQQPAVSRAQERFYLLNDDVRYAPALNTCWAYWLHGGADVHALHFAINTLAARHDILNSRFEMIGGEVKQQIVPAGIALHTLDLSALPGKEDRLRQFISAASARPFNLRQDALLRVTLITLGPRRHLLFFSAHHIILDGWSIALIAKEISSYYRLYQDGRPLPSARLPQFADYLRLQRQPGAEAARRFWKETFGGERSFANLVFPVRHLPATNRKGGKRTLTFSPQVKQLLNDFMRREKTTLFNTFLATLYLLVFKYTGRKDIVIATNLAGRWRQQFMDTIGLFTNTVPLRAALDTDMDFAALLHAVRKKNV